MQKILKKTGSQTCTYIVMSVIHMKILTFDLFYKSIIAH